MKKLIVIVACVALGVFLGELVWVYTTDYIRYSQPINPIEVQR